MKITAFGETKSLNAWANDPRCAVTAQIIVRRINGGWESEQAITAGLNTQRRYNMGEALKIVQGKDLVDRCPECKRSKPMCISPCVEAIKRELNEQFPTDGTYGTSGDVELTDNVIERLADEAKQGYDPSQFKSRGGN